MEVDIRVTMGKTTCGECPCVTPGIIKLRCKHFDTEVDHEDDFVPLRCPACLAKYGTGDQPDPRDAVVEAAREAKAYFDREYPRTMRACDTQGKWKALSSALAALDAEGGKG